MVGGVEAGEASEEGTLVLGDGRRLGYASYGRPDGEPVLFFHGHPGSRLVAPEEPAGWRRGPGDIVLVSRAPTRTLAANPCLPRYRDCRRRPACSIASLA
jgi:hypothetical protein